MLLLKCQDKLLHLQKDLKNLIPLSLKVYASILKIRQGNPFLQDVLVDSWPDFNAVLVRPQREGQSSNFDTYRNSYVYFFKDIDSIPESFIEAFDWTQAFEVQGLQCSLQAMLVNTAQIRHARAEMTTLITFIQEKETCVSIPNLSGPKMAEMSSLTVSHAECVDKTWAFGGSDSSQQYVRTCIENSPSSCLMTNDCGTPISWALTDQYGAIRMAYTLPEHRGKGYAKCIISSLSDDLRQDGFPVYCHVEEDNKSSKALFRSLGFIQCRAMQAAANTIIAQKETTEGVSITRVIGLVVCSGREKVHAGLLNPQDTGINVLVFKCMKADYPIYSQEVLQAQSGNIKTPLI